MTYSPEAMQVQQEHEPRYFLEIGTHSSPVYLIGSRRFLPNERYIGIDINPEELQSAAGTARIIRRESVGGTHFVNADGRQLPLVDGSVHEALLSNVLGDPKTKDRPQLLQQLYRVLAQHGKLIVSENYTPGIAPEDQTVKACQEAGFTLRRLIKPTDPDWLEQARQYGNLSVMDPDGNAYLAEFEKMPSQ